jgi:hypothetical protein
VSSVQANPSLQFIGVLWQTPLLQASPTVQGFPSLQGPVIGLCPQASVAGSQVSAVQALPSSHAPTCEQEVPVQESTVHGSPSSQLSCVPLWQNPLLQTSPAVHGSPSLHEAVLLVCRQVSDEQESVVQTFPSSQFNGVPTQPGPNWVTAQRSLVVQGSPSLQGFVLADSVTQLSWMQLSFVQMLPSHSAGPCWMKLKHPDCVVQTHWAHGPFWPQSDGLGAWTQPVLAWHESTVQEMLSLQLTAVPPPQLPPLQDIPVRQRFPEVHEPGALARRQEPVAGSHESAVQLLPSSQLIGGWLHAPVVGSHTSCVHGFESAQLVGVPWHTSDPPAAMQVSPEVQRL